MGQMHTVGPDLENRMHAPRSRQPTGVYKAPRIPKHSPNHQLVWCIELGMRGYGEPSRCPGTALLSLGKAHLPSGLGLLV